MQNLKLVVRQILRAVVALVVVLAAIELAMQLAIQVRARYFSKSDRYLAILGDSGRERIYPGWSKGDLRDLLRETYVPVVYEPFTGFAERPRHGRYVNVAADGYRFGAQPQPWPPDPHALNVFVFGGSTTFGYGVTDSQTIPSALQDSLRIGCAAPVHVYNFGRGFYYSTQERALFDRLVTAGFKPDVAVFIDGLNDAENADDTPPFTDDFARLFAVRQGDNGVWGSIGILTVTGRVLQRVLGSHDGREEHQLAAPEVGRRAAHRWIENLRLTAAAARGVGVLPVFVVQPVPAYRFDFSGHPMQQQVEGDPALPAMRAFYARLEEKKPDPVYADVVWLADLHENREAARVYVDPGHYSAEFSAYFGGELARAVNVRLGAACRQES